MNALRFYLGAFTLSLIRARLSAILVLSAVAGRVVVAFSDPIVPLVVACVSGCVVTRLQKLSCMPSAHKQMRFFIVFYFIVRC